MEGLTCVTRDGELTLVALCEGNRCRGGREGMRPGGGRLQLFRPAAEICAHVGTIELPTHLWFGDYSSLAVRGRPSRRGIGPRATRQAARAGQAAVSAHLCAALICPDLNLPLSGPAA